VCAALVALPGLRPTRGPFRDRGSRWPTARAPGPCRSTRSDRFDAHLVVEDNADLAYGLRNNSKIGGLQRWSVEMDQGVGTRNRDSGADLIILRSHAAGAGWLPCAACAADEGRRMPILILTAAGEEADKVAGLRLGADDYVTKPSACSRCWRASRRCLRRTAPPETAPESRRVRRRRGHPAPGTVLRKGKPVALTPRSSTCWWRCCDAAGPSSAALELSPRCVLSAAVRLIAAPSTPTSAELARQAGNLPQFAAVHLSTVQAGYRLEK